MTATRNGAVKFKGNPVTLAGNELKPGSRHPNSSCKTLHCKMLRLAASKGKTRIVATVPSLDTGVCSAETKKFNDLAKSLPNAEILAVSMDLPFAQKRWCGAEGVTNVKTLSAHQCPKFGEDYGVLIQGGPLNRILARAVFVVDPNGKLKHVEYVKEITEHPNYDAALAAAKS